MPEVIKRIDEREMQKTKKTRKNKDRKEQREKSYSERVRAK